MTPKPLTIRTNRLRLVAGTAAIVQAERESLTEFGRLLGVTVPANWPPELVDAEVLEFWLGQLQASPEQVGWWCWYVLLEDTGTADPILIGGAGFKGQPTPDGTVETGYSVLPQFRKRGYCTEAVQALIRWAFNHPETSRVVAQTLPELLSSIRVLEKNGFARLDQAFEEGAIAFELPRARYVDSIAVRNSDAPD